MKSFSGSTQNHESSINAAKPFKWVSNNTNSALRRKFAFCLLWYLPGLSWYLIQLVFLFAMSKAEIAARKKVQGSLWGSEYTVPKFVSLNILHWRPQSCGRRRLLIHLETGEMLQSTAEHWPYGILQREEAEFKGWLPGLNLGQHSECNL